MPRRTAHKDWRCLVCGVVVKGSWPLGWGWGSVEVNTGAANALGTLLPDTRFVRICGACLKTFDGWEAREDRDGNKDGNEDGV